MRGTNLEANFEEGVVPIMNDFSEDQMYRPLFEEPTHEIERGDAWEGPLGFLVGGMANQSLQQLAEQYFDAAFLLTEIIQNHQREDYRLANPTLFLYRHSIELLLKAALGVTAKTHSLDELADDLVTFVKRESGREVPSWITARIKELAKIDPGSTAFLYGENWDKTARKDLPVEGEFHVDLLHLQRVMNTLKTALYGLLNADEKL
jgi:HEPN domain-containing protein